MKFQFESELFAILVAFIFGEIQLILLLEFLLQIDKNETSIWHGDLIG